MSIEKKIIRSCLWGILIVALGVIVLVASALIVVNNREFQRSRVTELLKKCGFDADFETFHIGFLISDEIEIGGATLNLPNGKRFRIEKLIARHNGFVEIFTGTLVFRDFSCEGFSYDDHRGRRQLNFSCVAEELSASVPLLDPETAYSINSPLPFTLRAKNFQLRAGGKTFAEGSFEGQFHGVEPVAVSGKVHGDFARLLSQPLFSKINNVAKGTFELTGSGETAQLILSDLRSRYGNIEISKLALLAERGRDASGTLGIEIFGEQKTEMTLAFSSVDVGGGRLNFSGKTGAETLVVADVLRAGLLFRGEKRVAVHESPSSPRVPVDVSSTTFPAPKKEVSDSAKPTGADALPAIVKMRGQSFWTGVFGKMDFFVKHLVFPENEIGEHRGKISVSENRIEINYRTPDFYNGTASGIVALSFAPESSLYRLSGNIHGNEVEIHNLFPALRARNPRPIEGRVNFSVSLNAESATPETLEEKLVVNFDVESFGGGRIRIFNTDSKKIRLAGDIVRLGGSLANMLGGLTRNAEPRVSRLVDGAEVLRKNLTDFSYFKMSARGEYRAGGDVVCHQFEVLGESLRFLGNGSVRPISGEEPSHWPLAVSVESFARGDVADALREMGLLKNEAPAPVDDDFVFVRKFVFSGTPGVASDRFFETLLDAASGKEVRHDRKPTAPAKNPIDALLFKN